jgi:hypothetical protein
MFWNAFVSLPNREGAYDSSSSSFLEFPTLNPLKSISSSESMKPSFLRSSSSPPRNSALFYSSTDYAPDSVVSALKLIDFMSLSFTLSLGPAIAVLFLLYSSSLSSSGNSYFVGGETLSPFFFLFVIVSFFFSFSLALRIDLVGLST